MNYNIIIKTAFLSYHLLDITEADVFSIARAYEEGRKNVFINGKKCILEKIYEIQIFTFDKNISLIRKASDIITEAKRHNLLLGEYDKYVSEEVLESLGKYVTEYFIKGDYGEKHQVKSKIKDELLEEYVDTERIEELSKIVKPNYDLTRLIQLLKELNFAYYNKAYLTIPILLRAIIDHVPPIFGKSNFADVCGSYGGRSFKDSMNHLDSSLRKIADSYLHAQIRNKETLPNKTQVNFKQDLDFMLQEIVRINKL